MAVRTRIYSRSGARTAAAERAMARVQQKMASVRASTKAQKQPVQSGPANTNVARDATIRAQQAVRSAGNAVKNAGRLVRNTAGSVVNRVRQVSAPRASVTPVVYRPATSSRVVTTTTPVQKRSTTGVGLSNVGKTIAGAAIAGAGTVGSLLAYDAISARLTVPDQLANPDAADMEFRMTVLEALDALLAGQSPADVEQNYDGFNPLQYDPYTQMYDLGDGLALGPTYAETELGWVDEAIDDGGMLVYDNGEPVAVMQPDGTVVGLTAGEQEQIKRKQQLNWPIWLAAGALLIAGVYYVLKRSKNPALSLTGKPKRSML